MRDTSKAFPIVQVHYIQSLSLIHSGGYLVIKGDPKPMLTGPDPLAVLYVPCDYAQDDLLHEQ